MRIILAVSCGILLILIASCSSQTSMDMGNSQPASIAATGAAVSPILGATAVNVTLSEFAVTMDTVRIPRGPVHLVVRNEGQRPHELRIYPKNATATGTHAMTSGIIPGTVGLLQIIPAGATAVLDVTLPSGTWEVGCHLQEVAQGAQFDHYDRGMKGTLTAS